MNAEAAKYLYEEIVELQEAVNARMSLTGSSPSITIEDVESALSEILFNVDRSIITDLAANFAAE